MKTVYFVRHGQSEANVAPEFQGPDSPLSARGIEQAHAVAERASRIEFDTLISSPFARALATAEAIAQVTGKEPEFSALFVERIKPTSINGKPYTDEKAAKLWREWETSLHTPGVRIEDGENFEDLVARADAALAYLDGRQEERLLVVTHGYFLRTIIARVLLKDSLNAAAFHSIQRSAHVENTGITVIRRESWFESEDEWKLNTYNDHAHLG